MSSTTRGRRWRAAWYLHDDGTFDHAVSLNAARPLRLPVGGLPPTANLAAQLGLLSGTLNGSGEEKLAVAGLSLLVLGAQVVFGAFLLSILGLRRRRSDLGARPD